MIDCEIGWHENFEIVNDDDYSFKHDRKIIGICIYFYLKYIKNYWITNIIIDLFKYYLSDKMSFSYQGLGGIYNSLNLKESADFKHGSESQIQQTASLIPPIPLV